MIVTSSSFASVLRQAASEECRCKNGCYFRKSYLAVELDQMNVRDAVAFALTEPLRYSAQDLAPDPVPAPPLSYPHPSQNERSFFWRNPHDTNQLACKFSHPYFILRPDSSLVIPGPIRRERLGKIGGLSDPDVGIHDLICQLEI